MIPAPTRHAPLARPDEGAFHRHELAVLGAPCAVIADLVTRLAAALAPALRLAYVDADHGPANRNGSADESAVAPAAVLTAVAPGWRLDTAADPAPAARRALLAAQSLALVNGNHFGARQQVVLLYPRKPLDHEFDRLTDVRLILHPADQPALPAALRAHLGTAADAVPRLVLTDTAAIAAWVRRWYAAARPPVRGLVLAGGASERMQTDKSRLRYHGAEQRQHVATLLAPFCEEVFVSGRAEQLTDLPTPLRALPDQFLGLGPMGGLLTAFRHDPNAAWLVVACDLPFLTAPSLGRLLAGRDAGRVATAFRDPATGWPEPLVALWEPRAYGVLLGALGQGRSCPRKVLINADPALLDPGAPAELRNVNTPDERAAAERELRARPPAGT